MKVRNFSVWLLAFFMIAESAHAVVTTISVGRSSNDAEQRVHGNYFSSDRRRLKLGAGHYFKSWVGLRFENVDTAQGGTVSTANLSFVSASYRRGPMTLRITGQSADNCQEFYEGDNDLRPENRPRTDAFVDWEIDTRWKRNKRYNSPGIANIINEIVHRPGWEAGNAICLFVERAPGSHSFGFRPVKAFEGTTNPSRWSELTLDTATGRDGNWGEYDTTYYLLENFPQATCGPNPTFDGMTLAPTEESALWAGRCRDNYVPCSTQIGCDDNWDMIPWQDVSGSGRDVKRIYGGVRYVNVPSCEMPCSQAVQVREPDTDNEVTAYIWDACPNNHWTNQLNTVRFPSEPFHCARSNNHVDLFEDLYVALGGDFTRNIQVEIDEPLEPITVCGDYFCGINESAMSCAQDCAQFNLIVPPIEDELDGSDKVLTVSLPEALTGSRYIEVGLKNTSTGWQTVAWGTTTATLNGIPGETVDISVNIANPESWMAPLAGSVGVYRWVVYVYPDNTATGVEDRIYTIEDSSYEFWYDYSDLVVEPPEGCGDNFCSDGETPSSCPVDCGSFSLVNPPVEAELDGSDEVLTVTLPEAFSGTRYIEVGLKNTTDGWTTNAWGTATVTMPGTPDGTADISVNIANPQSWMTPLAGSVGTYRWVIYVYPDAASASDTANRIFTLEDATYEFTYDYTGL